MSSFVQDTLSFFPGMKQMDFPTRFALFVACLNHRNVNIFACPFAL